VIARMSMMWPFDSAVPFFFFIGQFMSIS